MNRNTLMAKARKIMAQKQAQQIAIPWFNIDGRNPPPENWKGLVVNFTVLPECEEDIAIRKRKEIKNI